MGTATLTRKTPTAHMAPGSVSLLPVELQEARSAGGIVLASKKESYDNLRYGVVVGCGIYISHRGHLHPELEDFPLPPGTLVEHKVANPFVDRDKHDLIKTEDITRWWLKGDWPEWAKL